jgi:hypothetical protein
MVPPDPTEPATGTGYDVRSDHRITLEGSLVHETAY